MDEKLINELIQTAKLEELSPEMREMAELIGLENVIALSKRFHSDTVYFPCVNSILMSARNHKIIEEFTGYNLKELSRKYGISQTQIRYIIEGK